MHKAKSTVAEVVVLDTQLFTIFRGCSFSSEFFPVLVQNIALSLSDYNNLDNKR